MHTLAVFVADHPLICFALLTLGLLAFAGLLWAMVERLRHPLWQWTATGWQRYGAPRWPQLQLPARLRGSHLLLDLLAGFAVVAASLSAFLAVADEIALDEDLGRFDDHLASALRERLQPRTLQIFAAVTHLGDFIWLSALCLTVTALLLWRRRYLLALGWFAGLAGNGLLNRLLKALFERSRPLHEHGYGLVHGWSFPSGHASGALVAYGMLAYLLILFTPRAWHLPITLLTIAVVLLVGYSRIVLQVHYFSDVLAGFLCAGAWLTASIAAIELARAPLSPR